jgi:hypothetical protein
MKMSFAYAVVPDWLLQLYLKLSLGKLSHFSAIWQAFGALMFLLEPKGRGGKAARASFTVNTLSSVSTEKFLHHKVWRTFGLE